LVQKKAKGNKKRNNKYLPTTLHLSIFPLRKQTKNILFFVITQKKIKALFFVTSLKEKKKLLSKIFAIPSLKDLT
jgi:hypothetical protein